MTFERTADATLETVKAIYSQRGAEYSDTWDAANVVSTYTQHTLRAIGADRSPAAMRLLQLAALVDVKDSRMLGPWKADSAIDGIAYRAAWATLRDEYETANKTAD